ncbi:MAG: acyl carrier protein [Pseudomonadota bacterium]
MTKIEDIEDFIASFISREAMLDIDDIDFDANLGSFGLSSMVAVKLVGMLEDNFGGHLTPVVVFENPTVTRLAKAVAHKATLTSA